MRIAIVGHGPSLLQENKGAEIDSHNLVVRLKRSKELLLHPEHYGTQVDCVVGSFVVGLALKKHWDHCGRFFLFTDTRTQDVTPQEIRGMQTHFFGVECIIDKPLCDYWIDAYRANRKTIELDPRQEPKGKLSDSQGHLHPSAGTFSIVYVLAHLKPESISLYGFDSLLSGEWDYSITRGEEYSQYPDHNFRAEKELLQLICSYYNYTLDNNENELVKL